jgi:hypothetical protein
LFQIYLFQIQIYLFQINDRLPAGGYQVSVMGET